MDDRIGKVRHRFVVMRTGLSFALLLACTPVGVRAASADGTAVIEPHQNDDVLRATYAKGKRMMLPRLLLLDAQGRLLLAEVGLRGGVGHRLAKALDGGQPMDTPISLDAVLPEVLDATGKPVAKSDLPKADAYVVDYWAEWCGPCRMLARDIESQMHRWKKDGKQVVWLKIESDPEKSKEKKH